MIQLLLSLVFLTQANAIELDQSFKGRFKRKHLPHDGVVIHPDHVKFRFCPKAMIFHQQFIEERAENAIGLKNAQKEFILDARDNTHNPKCLAKGMHYCTFTLNRWDNRQDYLDLIVSCDDSDFVRIYEKRIRFGRH